MRPAYFRMHNGSPRKQRRYHSAAKLKKGVRNESIDGDGVGTGIVGVDGQDPRRREVLVAVGGGSRELAAGREAERGAGGAERALVGDQAQGLRDAGQ